MSTGPFPLPTSRVMKVYNNIKTSILENKIISKPLEFLPQKNGSFYKEALISKRHQARIRKMILNDNLIWPFEELKKPMKVQKLGHKKLARKLERVGEIEKGMSNQLSKITEYYKARVTNRPKTNTIQWHINEMAKNKKTRSQNPNEVVEEADDDS